MIIQAILNWSASATRNRGNYVRKIFCIHWPAHSSARPTSWAIDPFNICWQFTAVGLIAAALLKNDNLASKLLTHYPRYSLAMDAYRILQDIKYPVLNSKDPNGNPLFINIGVLSIDDPGWAIMLDFIQSEPAVRKSERNEPAPLQPTLQSHAPNGAADGSSSQSPDQLQMVAKILPPINFDRIKTIAAIRSDVASAGGKSLVPPYSLVVLWPPLTARRVYEFLSFEEFRLDLRRMILDEIEESALWLSVIAFFCTVPINALRGIAASAEQKKLVGTALTASTQQRKS